MGAQLVSTKKSIEAIATDSKIQEDDGYIYPKSSSMISAAAPAAKGQSIDAAGGSAGAEKGRADPRGEGIPIQYDEAWLK